MWQKNETEKLKNKNKKYVILVNFAGRLFMRIASHDTKLYRNSHLFSGNNCISQLCFVNYVEMWLKNLSVSV